MELAAKKCRIHERRGMLGRTCVEGRPCPELVQLPENPATLMPPQYEILVMPRNPVEIEAATRRSRKRLTRTAAIASAASVIPLPGIDIAVDAGALIKLIPEINREFGLTPAQIEQLSPNKQLIVYKAVVAVGGAMIGKLITRELVIEALKTVGVRLTVKQATKYVPIAGQALSAAIGFAAMQYVGRSHIRECARVVEMVRAQA
jgi:hypothetical protein